MLIPASLYGTYDAVARRSNRALTRLRQGVSFVDAIGGLGEALGTDITPGLLLLHGPSPLLGRQQHFQCFVPHRLVRTAVLKATLPREVAENTFQLSLQSPWGVLGLLSNPNQGWLTADRLRPTMQAVLEFWDELTSVGARYSTGMEQGVDLWTARGNLGILLADLGIPTSVLREPLPNGGLATVLRNAGRANDS